jgi:hypothetical protein
MTEPKVEQKEVKVKVEKVKAKAIQISTSTTNTGQVLLVALMDDGTIYQRIVNSDAAKWVEVPAI